jgi:hypothetical protein
MSTSTIHDGLRVAEVLCDEGTLRVRLRNGEWLSSPLARFPRLLAGTAEQRAAWVVAGAGFGIHWPELDEDISVDSLRHPEAYPRVARIQAKVAEKSSDGRTKHPQGRS